MSVEYRPSAVDRSSPEAQSVGSGPVWVFSDGGVTVGTWARDTNEVPIGLFDADGAPIALNPGNTWIELADIADVDAGGVEVLAPAPPAP